MTVNTANFKRGHPRTQKGPRGMERGQYHPAWVHIGNTEQTVMKEVVLVTLATDPKMGTIIPDAPFLVKPRRPDPSAVFEKEPEWIAHFLPAQNQARFT